MIFICALLPVCNLAVLLSYGGVCSAMSVLLTFLLLPLLARAKRQSLALLPLFAISSGLRLCALFSESSSALGSIRAFIVVLACAVAAALAAYNGDSVFHAPTPLFFITAFLAMYILLISGASSEFYSLSVPSGLELLSAVLCPLSSCLAFSVITQYPPFLRAKGALLGVLVSVVFLLCKGASAELGFILVPLAVCASALEIKAVIGIIIKARE